MWYVKIILILYCEQGEGGFGMVYLIQVSPPPSLQATNKKTSAPSIIHQKGYICHIS